MPVFAGLNTVVMAALFTSFKDLEDSWRGEKRKACLKTSYSKKGNCNRCFGYFVMTEFKHLFLNHQIFESIKGTNDMMRNSITVHVY